MYHSNVFILCLLTFITTVNAADDASMRIEKGSGGSNRTKLSAQIVLNKQSSLQREWITISDKTLPATFNALTGILTKYERGEGYSGKYLYTSRFSIVCTEAISAIEVKFVIFDIWGDRIKTLVTEDIRDMAPGTHYFSPDWNLHSENEAESFYASIAYISRIRTKSGKVTEANVAPVIEEAKVFNQKFQVSDLDKSK